MTINQQTLLSGFERALEAWLAAHDAAVADLTARHEAHKASIEAAEKRFEAWTSSRG